jgi:hypothetical protein
VPPPGNEIVATVPAPKKRKARKNSTWSFSITVCTKHLAMWCLQAYKYGPVLRCPGLHFQQQVCGRHGQKATCSLISKQNKDGRQAATAFPESLEYVLDQTWNAVSCDRRYIREPACLLCNFPIIDESWRGRWLPTELSLYSFDLSDTSQQYFFFSQQTNHQPSASSTFRSE